MSQRSRQVHYFQPYRKQRVFEPTPPGEIRTRTRIPCRIRNDGWSTRRSADVILVLTEEVDPHADRVITALRQAAGPRRVVRFNPARFPSTAELSFSCSASGQVRRRLCVEGETVDLDSVTAVWYRRPRPPVPHAEI